MLISSLNPYSTGSWVAGYQIFTSGKIGDVLILILLEVGLLDTLTVRLKDYCLVLILILLEVGLLVGLILIV